MCCQEELGQAAWQPAVVTGQALLPADQYAPPAVVAEEAAVGDMVAALGMVEGAEVEAAVGEAVLAAMAVAQELLGASAIALTREQSAVSAVLTSIPPVCMEECRRGGSLRCSPGFQEAVWIACQPVPADNPSLGALSLLHFLQALTSHQLKHCLHNWLRCLSALPSQGLARWQPSSQHCLLAIHSLHLCRFAPHCMPTNMLVNAQVSDRLQWSVMHHCTCKCLVALQTA